ncbi:hypothetical protein M9Y10_007979 [Tritrichomonas musculus]|uniref:Uncharacterized protein n=1 Tax=Tritrichomonas musculus TaxID=1915356 RepID=A0ABR2J300_9EUKA
MKKEEKEEDKKHSLLNKPVVSRLMKPLLSCFTCNYELNSIAPRICFTEKKPDFVNVENVNGQYNGQNLQFYKKRCSYVPLNLSTYSNNHFIIAIGKTLYSFDEETYEIHQTLQLNEELLSVKQAKSTKDFLILTSLKSVVVVNANNFTKNATISPKNLNENNLIIQKVDLSKM